MNKLPVFTSSRSCGTCTKCCEGWLGSAIHGKQMHKGRPCFYLDKDCSACSIYADRPQDPCVDYSCTWLLDKSDEFPMWMKPNISNVIITNREVENGGNVYRYVDIIEAGSRMDVDVLNWLFHWVMTKGVNVRYEVSGNKFILGDPTFAEALSNEKT